MSGDGRVIRKGPLTSSGHTPTTGENTHHLTAQPDLDAALRDLAHAQERIDSLERALEHERRWSAMYREEAADLRALLDAQDGAQ